MENNLLVRWLYRVAQRNEVVLFPIQVFEVPFCYLPFISTTNLNPKCNSEPVVQLLKIQFENQPGFKNIYHVSLTWYLDKR
jgi:hypothetical protein